MKLPFMSMIVIAGTAVGAVKVPEYRAVEPGCASETIVLGTDGHASTGRFRVSDVMNANVFGRMDKADDKFVRNAASVELKLDGETLIVDFDCPVPSGMTAKKKVDAWNGDRVELLVRPRLDSDEVSVFAANCGGAYSAHGFRAGVRNMGWSSASKITVTNDSAGFKVHMEIPVKDAFNKIPESGDAFGVNFQRLGRTCSGHSAWAMNGSGFDTSRWVFGTLVVGDPGDYLRRRFAAYADRCRDVAAKSPSAAAEVRKVAGAVKGAIDAHAGEPGACAAIDAMFGELDQALVAISLEGNPVLIYDSGDVWGNRPQPQIGTKPMERIVLKAPRNTLRIKAFAIANLTDGDYLGNLKVLANPNRFYSRTRAKERPQPTIADAFTLRRGVWGRRKNGKPNADATVELALKSLVEIGAGKVMPVYLELDTHGLAAGSHRLWLGLESAVGGFPSPRIPIDVTITDDDLDTVEVHRLVYTHLHDSCRNGHRPLVNCIRTLVQRGYNDLLISRFDDLYPHMNGKGEWVAPDYVAIDRWIDLWISGGLPAKKMYLRPFIAVERERSDTFRGLRDAAGRRVPFASPEYEKGMRLLVSSFARHVQKKYGIPRERILWYPVDEANGRLEDAEYKSSLSRCRWMGRLIKDENPANQSMWNPLPNFMATDEFAKAAPAFAKLFDMVMPYRPTLTARAIAIIRGSGTRRVGTYRITTYEAPASAYRRGVWQNLRDGFAPIDSYWHLDESAAFAGREHGYGSCIVDKDYDLIALTRRQLGADMAHHEGRLVLYLRRKFAGDTAKLAQIAAIVKTAADTGSMPALDAALEQLLELL